MRKIIYIFLTFIMIFLCVSCGKVEETPDEPVNPSVDPTPIIVDNGELEYILSEDGLSYILSGMGTYKKNDLNIQNTFNNLPVSSICEGAFYGKELNSVVISNDINVEKGAFKTATIKELTMPKLYGGYLGYIFGGEKASTNKSVVPATLEKVTLTNETKLQDTAFTGCVSLKSIVLNDKISEIGSNVFYNCENLTFITMPKELVKVGENAFYNCNNIDTVYYNGEISNWCNIEFISFESTPMFSANKFILNNQLLEELNIPSGITNIKDYTFAGFRSVKKVTLSTDLKDIGYMAFFDLTSNKEFFINGSASYKTIDGVLFKENELILYPIGLEQSSYTIPNFVTSISNNAFYHAVNLENISFGESNIDTIGEATFKNCISLKRIVLPTNVVKLESELLMCCTNIESIVLSPLTTYIGQSCFENCTKIEKIVIPLLVETVKEYAFRHCESLTIYCCASSAGSGWVKSYWNVYPARPVVWDYVEE